MIGKFYLAAKFSAREYMELVADKIHYADPYSQCVARWVYGGEEGLTRESIALLDLDDVAKADTVILFTHERGSLQPGGGRFVEFGYGLALGKRMIVIGPHENVFMHYPKVTVYESLTAFLNSSEFS